MNLKSGHNEGGFRGWEVQETELTIGDPSPNAEMAETSPTLTYINADKEHSWKREMDNRWTDSTRRLTPQYIYTYYKQHATTRTQPLSQQRGGTKIGKGRGRTATQGPSSNTLSTRPPRKWHPGNKEHNAQNQVKSQCQILRLRE